MKSSHMMIMALIAVVLVMPRGAESRELTLSEALQLATGESPRVAAKEAAEDVAASGETAALSTMTPQLNFSESFVRTNDPVGVFGAKLDQGKFSAADLNIDRLNHPGSINNWITRVELAVPVFQSGTDWAHLRAAHEQRSSAKSLTDFERARVRLAATNLYYTSVALAEQHRSLLEGIGRLKKLEGSYQLLEAPNSAATTNVLVARSVRENLEAQAVKVECERKKAERDLAALVGIDPEEPLGLRDDLPPVDRASPRLAQEVQPRADLVASAASVRAASAERDAALRRWGPDVQLVGAYNVYTGNFQDAEGAYEVGARLTWPVFNLGRQARTHEAKAQLLEAQHLHRAAELNARADLTTSEERLRSCLSRFRIVSQAVATAGKALNEASLRYDEGSLPLMDYSQTIQNWVQMRMNLIDNHLGVAVAKAEYDFHRGAGE